MPILQFLTKIWLCRALLKYNFTICCILYFSRNIRLEPPLHAKSSRQRIKAYWNIPTFQCDTYKLNFTSLAQKYGIIQNEDDRFRGKFINILYDPGSFPAILKNANTTVLRNGGVPQQGNLTLHLNIFENILNQLIPNKGFSGIGIIDFESWRPIFRQNFGTLLEYKTLSISIEKSKHPLWNQSQLTTEATRRFEKAAKIFMARTLILAQKVRPKATWGYYAYPYCFNMSPNNMKSLCPSEVRVENDRLKWLFQLSDNYYPSIYIGNSSLSAPQKVQMIEGRIEESHRIMKSLNIRKNIIIYFWYKYQDTNKFLNKSDVFNIFTVLASANIDGVILWGSSNDVNTRSKCVELYNYIDDILGPALVYNFS
ncbi:unnamed protein product [Diabrotica balteata]|uniref:Hyaluronidase n=1 Tax=Diabrotica balteata TaxID=107213 RepID=A0A9N9SZS8_DIABA|nr:unnamed protein product [Diabrotica balteata]